MHIRTHTIGHTMFICPVMDFVFNISLQDSQCPSFILGPYRSSVERDETMDSIVSVSSGMSGMVRDDIHQCCHEIHIVH